MIDSLILKKHLTILVSSIYTLNLLINYKNKGAFDGEIVLIGGRINSKHYRASGTLAVEFMSGFHVDKAFVVADGLQLDTGITSYEDDRGLLARTFMKQAKQTIVLADHTKIGTSHFYKFADFREVDMVVSDVPPPAAWESKLTEEDVHWIVAD